MKILVIEDDRRIANYIKKGLEIKNHTVDLAFDGQYGFDLATEGKYEVIILDRMLPGLDGIEVCRKLRHNKISTPILMLTARTQLDERVEGLEAGADDYLGKPFAFVELLARVKALSRRPHNSSDSVFEISDLKMDISTIEVTRSGRQIKLSKKEFALLEFLIRNQGKVFSPEQLTEHVWDYDSDVLPNTAQVYIGYLRVKIDKAFPRSPELIQTVRGFGYKLGE